jgi:probable rRNA maturation factor
MTRPDRHRLQVSVTGRALRPAMRTGLARWLERAAPASARGAVDVAVVSDREIRRLNAQYREVDAPTDVLSFPAAVSPEAGASDPAVPRFLGDIRSPRRGPTQAADYRHSPTTELRTLALHGLLHLLGYDHEHDDGRMRRAEDRLRRRAGLPRGLIARSVRASTQA